MTMKILFMCVAFVAYVNAGLIGHHATAIVSHPVAVVENNPPNYEFQYSVHDAHTGDIKDQFEHRRGDYVTGRYSLIEPDGHRRIVDYSADPLLGFTAQVRRELPTIHSHTVVAAHPTLLACRGSSPLSNLRDSKTVCLET